MGKITHFGLNLGKSKFGHSLVDSQYGMWDTSVSPGSGGMMEDYEDISLKKYSQFYFDRMRPEVLRNYELNLAHFDSLDRDSFNNSLNSLVNGNHKLKLLGKGYTFKEVFDLSDFKQEGHLVYVMVLDGYKQYYIGQTNDLVKRARAHWVGNQAFDRLVFASPDTSKLAMKSFRALDTTRIFIVDGLTASQAVDLERKLIHSFDTPYLTNRVLGGYDSNGDYNPAKDILPLKLIK